jgi:DUF4097 and DUF4098 domain-containing protein YvlB
VAATASIKLHVASGAVQIVGWARDSVHLEGVMADGESLFALAAPNGLKFGAEGRTVRGASRLTVYVPQRADLTVRSASADVQVRAFEGVLDIGAAAAAVEVYGAPTSCTIEALAGDVLVHAQVEALRVRTHGGRITLRGAVVEAQLASVSGAVDVLAAELPALRINTVSGAVSIATSTALRAPVQVETFGGNVTVARPASAAVMYLHSDTGPVTVDGKRRAPTAVPSNTSASTLTVRTFRGAIVVQGPPS